MIHYFHKRKRPEQQEFLLFLVNKKTKQSKYFAFNTSTVLYKTYFQAFRLVLETYKKEKLCINLIAPGSYSW